MAPQSDLPALQLEAIVDQLEFIQKEQRQLGTQISELYRQAKAAGFDPKALKALLIRRATDTTQAAEMTSLVDLYDGALKRARQGEAA